jgi:cation diffusion facilitator family transporter
MGPDVRHAAAGSIRVVVFNLALNACLAMGKGICGVLGNTNALITDAMESTLDIVKSVVVLGGLSWAAVPPDENHPYGHGKAEPLAAIIVALALMGGAVGMAIVCVREILDPTGPPAAWTLAVLVVVMAVKEGMFQVTVRTGRSVGSQAMRAHAWDNRSDALTSLAAFIGIGIALLGGEGFEAADDWAALVACGVVLVNGYRILGPAVGEIMDVAPDPAVADGVTGTALAIDGVEEVDSCLVRKMGLDYFVDLHIGVHGELSVREGHELAHSVKDRIRDDHPRVRDVLVHIEPAEGEGAADSRGDGGEGETPR